MEQVAEHITRMAASMGTHSFDRHGHQHLLKFVCLNTRRIPATFTTLAKDDPRGGRLLARRVNDVREFVKLTHDTMPSDVVGTIHTVVECVPFRGIIVAFPAHASSPALLRALGVTTTITLKLSDGKGLGKSTPRFSETSIRTLCPRIPPNVHALFPRLSSSSSSSSPPPPPSQHTNIHDTLLGRIAGSTCLDAVARERGLLFLAAYRERAFDTFDDIFAPFCEIPADACAIALSTRELVRTLITLVPETDTATIDALYTILG